MILIKDCEFLPGMSNYFWNFEISNVLFQLLTHKQPNLESVKKVEKITSLGAKLWKILPHDYKELTSLSTFILPIILFIYLFCCCCCCCCGCSQFVLFCFAFCFFLIGINQATIFLQRYVSFSVLNKVLMIILKSCQDRMVWAGMPPQDNFTSLQIRLIV